MEIKLLGTGSAEGWPGLFCGCAICRRSRELGGKNLRSRSAALIDGALKIDLPPDTLHHVLAHGLDMSLVEHLLFTHAHNDHCSGPELQYLSWMFVPQPIARPLHIVASRTTIDTLTSQVQMADLPITIDCIEPWQTVDLGRWRVTAIAAQHDPDQIALNFLIASGGKTLLYATDTGWYEQQTWDFLGRQRVDGVVVECTKGMAEGGYSGHLSIPDLVRMRRWLLDTGVMTEGARMITTHHSHLSGMLHDDFERKLARHGIEAGYDGLTFEL